MNQGFGMSSWKGPKRSTKHYIYNIRSLKAQGPEGSLQYVKPIKWLYSIFSHILFLLPPSDYTLSVLFVGLPRGDIRNKTTNLTTSAFFLHTSMNVLLEGPTQETTTANHSASVQCCLWGPVSNKVEDGQRLPPQALTRICKVTVYYEISFP